MTLPIEKPKRKIKVYQTPSDSILTFLGIKPTQFEFAIDLSLWECKERLGNQRKKRGFWGWLFGGSEITVEVWPMSSGTYEFRVLKNQAKHPDVLVRGLLTEVSDDTSAVSGQISISQVYAYSLLIFLILLIGAALITSFVAIVLPFIVLFWFGGMWSMNSWLYYRDRHLLLERFQNAFLRTDIATSKRKRSL